MNTFRHAEAVMGTTVNFEIHLEDSQASAAIIGAKEAIGAAVDWLHWVDETFSTYRPGSEINRLDRHEIERSACTKEVAEILALCDDLGPMTHGYFDASASGHLDPSGVVKGWSVERASALLSEAGWPNHVVEAGGDVRISGRRCGDELWQVAITHPFRLDAFCAVVRVGEGAVATSGSYERGLHVLDPLRGVPATALASVTLLGPELVLTDAYATAAMAMGDQARDWLDGLDGYDALIIDTLGRAWETPGFARCRVTGPVC